MAHMSVNAIMLSAWTMPDKISISAMKLPKGGRPKSAKMPRAKMEPANGKYRVTHVYRDGPADKEWVDIHDGDYVLAIDGTELKILSERDPANLPWTQTQIDEVLRGFSAPTGAGTSA